MQSKSFTLSSIAADGHRVIYTMGSIESPQLNKYLIDVLEGTRPAFDNRDSKYYAS